MLEYTINEINYNVVMNSTAMNKGIVLLLMSVLIASSTAGCIGADYLDRFSGEESEDKKKNCDKKCLKQCLNDGGTDAECEERCDLDKLAAEETRNNTADAETSTSQTDQEDCEARGGTWTEASDREGEYYCDEGVQDSEDSTDDSTSEEDSSEDRTRDDEKCYNDQREEVHCEE